MIVKTSTIFPLQFKSFSTPNPNSYINSMSAANLNKTLVFFYTVQPNQWV